MRPTTTLALLFLIGLGSQSMAAQPSTPPSPQARAQAALNAGQPDSAIVILEAFFRNNPTATAGWLLLGNAYRQKGDQDHALNAYGKVTAPPAALLQARFGIASILAQRGASDSAMTLLEQLKASGAFDMELAATAPEFAALRSHPRFSATQFHAADFRSPFVEPVRIIHEWVGETKGDQFSWIARGIGDVDGDRISDVVASAPSFGATGGPNGRGRVYVYSGKSGRLIWQFTGDSTDNLGTGLEGAGDVNADGVPDVVAGAPGSGRAQVLSGRDGKVLLTLRGTVQESFGSAAAGAGDQNGDGHADVIIGAPSANGIGVGSGRAYVFSGKDGALLRTLEGQRAGDAFGSIVAGDKRGKATPLLVGAPAAGANQRGRAFVFRSSASDTAPHIVFDADSTGAALGAMFTSIVGDVNGDGVADVYASDYTNGARGPGTGRAYVRSGSDGHVLLTLTGESAGDGFGIGSADVGDVDKDGYDDLLVGAWQHRSAASAGGKIYLYSGRNGQLLRSITGRIPGETLGFDATGIGDVDGDGVRDFLVASSWSNIRGFHTGRMFVISGAQAIPPGDSSQVVELSLASRIFGNTRSIRVYLPPGYSHGDTARRYPVFYFNDGSSVFSPRSWNAPRTLDSLIGARTIPPLIVVGIANAATIPGVANGDQARTNEYLPYPDSSEPDVPNPHGGRYPAFVVDEVMPLVARSFRIGAGPANTGMGGSSYGGIAALTTVLRRPGTFGMLLLESTPLFLFNGRLLEDSRLLTNWPASVYVGVGTRETGDTTVLRAGHHALEQFVSVVKEYAPGSRVQFNVVEGATHSGIAWGARLPAALSFLMSSSR